MQDFQRLGKRELGPHAFEQRMPTRIAALIGAEASQNKLTGVIPILATFLQHDSHVETAYLCDDAAIQVYKIKGEGNHFCAYRNMQMLLFHEQLKIPELQEMVEGAWDRGYNAHGRVETGGIKGTRKHVGTSEAQALLQSRKTACTAQVFSGKGAWKDLLDAVMKYFSHARDSTITGVCTTNLPPIFLQRPQHSLTIVGIEKIGNGKRRLLVFDPAYRPPAALRKTKNAQFSLLSTWMVLWRYRRDEAYLKRYRSYEVLFLEDKCVHD